MNICRRLLHLERSHAARRFACFLIIIRLSAWGFATLHPIFWRLDRRFLTSVHGRTYISPTTVYTFLSNMLTSMGLKESIRLPIPPILLQTVTFFALTVWMDGVYLGMGRRILQNKNKKQQSISFLRNDERRTSSN